jgi:ribosomal protein S18 acetylase RimI-like enzyme
VQLNGITQLKEPTACTAGQRRDFARLVRQGFEGSDDGLAHRIEEAHLLGFYYTTGEGLAAVAALKSPGERYRSDVFEKAGVAASPGDYRLELGWVYVVPAHRGKQVAEKLCRQLLACVPASCVFATTRISNAVMIRILLSLGFERVGKPYLRRNEKLIVFLREGAMDPRGDNRQWHPN